VLLRPETGTNAVKGDLLDVSAHGFRAVHHCRSLTSGQILTFEHAHDRGRARVVWTRIAGERVESGFCYLPSEAA
jgi:hypothetical protein